MADLECRLQVRTSWDVPTIHPGDWSWILWELRHRSSGTELPNVMGEGGHGTLDRIRPVSADSDKFAISPPVTLILRTR